MGVLCEQLGNEKPLKWALSGRGKGSRRPIFPEFSPESGICERLGTVVVGDKWLVISD